MNNQCHADMWSDLASFKAMVSRELSVWGDRQAILHPRPHPDNESRDNNYCLLGWTQEEVIHCSIELRIGWELTSGRYIVMDGAARVTFVDSSEQNTLCSKTRLLSHINAFNTEELHAALNELYAIIQEMIDSQP